MEPDFLPPLIRALEAVPAAGIACPLVLGDGVDAVQSLGGVASLWTGRCTRRFFGRPIEDLSKARWAEADFPIGACMLVKRALLEEVGPLNEAYFLYYEDVELGFRARHEAWLVLAIAQSRVRHRDTTNERCGDPLVSFYGTRNQAWVIAEYGRF